MNLKYSKLVHVLESFTADRANTDLQRLRAAIQAELDAINLYHQFANDSDNLKIKALMSDIAKEEKVHVAELEALLSEFDSEYNETNEEGKKEVKELFKIKDK